MKHILAFLPLICLFGCTTASITKSNGDKLAYNSFLTNYNVKTRVEDTSDSNVNPIPALSKGRFNGADSLTPTESTKDWAVMIGGEDGIKVGTQDQGTPAGIIGKWTYKIVRVVYVYKGFSDLVGGYFGNQSAKVAADVTKSTNSTNAGVTKHISDNRTALIPQVDPELVPIEALKSP